MRMCLASWEKIITGNGPGEDGVGSVPDSSACVGASTSRFSCSASFPPVFSASPLAGGSSLPAVSSSLEAGLSGLDCVFDFEGIPINGAPYSAGVLGANVYTTQ